MNNTIIKTFLAVTIFGIIGIVYLQYKDRQFYDNDLSPQIMQQIKAKEIEIRNLIKLHYGIDYKAPIEITDKLGTSRFGMATYDPSNGKIVIYLAKSRFKESLRYMISDVLPHEYAHALMFHLGHFPRENAGHSLKWQEACKNLNGLRCNRFVNHSDVLIDKTDFFK